MRRWVHGAPNGANDADQTPPEDDLLPESNSPGLTTSWEATETSAADTGPATQRPRRTAQRTSVLTSAGSRSRTAPRRYTAGRQLMATRQHKSVITTAPIHDITYHNHNKNIPCGL